ncbi:MAG: hypothetical protein JSV19_04225 [Phycisphaerales bacterium]|nr:MAG: hypothetical protein JSV19_04225 [Phycisphaerales bacterium]
MTHSHELEVNTVFSTTERGQTRSARARAPRSPTPWLGLISLAVAMTWVYVTWFPVNRSIKHGLLVLGLQEWSDQSGEIDMSFLFAPPPADLAHPAQPQDSRLDEDADAETDPQKQAASAGDEPEPREADVGPNDGQQLIEQLSVVSYAWLAVATIAACWLAACGGAALRGRWAGRAPSPSASIAGALLFVVAFTAGLVVASLAALLLDRTPASHPFDARMAITLVAAAIVGVAGAALGWSVMRRRDWGTRSVGLLLAAALIVNLRFWAYWARYDLPDWLLWIHSNPSTAGEIAFVTTVLAFAAVVSSRISTRHAVIAVVVLLLALIGLAAYSYFVIYIAIPAIAAWTCILLLFLISALIGVLLWRHSAWLHTAAVAIVLVASVATLAAMAYADRRGGFLENPPAALTYIKAFAAQSSYAWALLVVRWARR